MLNGEGNENGIKINRSNINKQKTKLHVQHTFFSNFFSLPLFFSTRTLFCRTKMPNFLVTHYFSHVLTQYFVSCVLRFYFSLPLIFTLLAARHFSLSHSRFEFSWFSSYKIRPFFSQITLKKTQLCCCFFFLKVRAAIRFLSK